MARPKNEEPEVRPCSGRTPEGLRTCDNTVVVRRRSKHGVHYCAAPACQASKQRFYHQLRREEARRGEDAIEREARDLISDITEGERTMCPVCRYPMALSGWAHPDPRLAGRPCYAMGRRGELLAARGYMARAFPRRDNASAPAPAPEQPSTPAAPTPAPMPVVGSPEGATPVAMPSPPQPETPPVPMPEAAPPLTGPEIARGQMNEPIVPERTLDERAAEQMAQVAARREALERNARELEEQAEREQAAARAGAEPEWATPTDLDWATPEPGGAPF